VVAVDIIGVAVVPAVMAAREELGGKDGAAAFGAAINVFAPRVGAMGGVAGEGLGCAMVAAGWCGTVVGRVVLGMVHLHGRR